MQGFYNGWKSPNSRCLNSFGWMMKTAVIGAFVVAGLVVFGVGGAWDEPTAWAQRVGPHEAAAHPELIALSAPAADRGQQITIIDPKTRTMAVYLVDAKASGGEFVQLVSVRKCDWDLQMEEFNATSPLPREVRGQVEPNKRR